jgi:hypothetical protein
MSQVVHSGIGSEAPLAPSVSSLVKISPYRPKRVAISGIGISASRIAIRDGGAIRAILLAGANAWFES